MMILILSLMILLTNWKRNTLPLCYHYEEMDASNGNGGIKLHSGFPCNQFGAQEPGTAEEVIFIGLCRRNCNFPTLQIAALVSSEFGVEFRMMEKVDVKGSNVHPVWRYLTGKALRG